MNEFTLGVEEEFMVVDPVSRELKSHEQKIVDSAQKIHEDQVKAEMHQAVVEVGTHICHNTDEARKEVGKLRGTVAQLAGDIGLRIGAAGTHPF
ncbi:MAG: Carboxylate-amine ligase YbdK, partial [Mucilaginibacter sp.]|nr:Carboxylate-amine ligase YbdK [Mucilaginibacter sp.]